MTEDRQPENVLESIWDYPRPPRMEDCLKHVQVIFNGVVIADSHQSVRVLETGHPPVFYIPPEDVLMSALEPTERRTTCEFKGEAHYFRVSIGERQVENAAWSYPSPTSPYERIKRYLAFYPGLMDACLVESETVEAEASDFYGGWITSEIIGLSEKQSRKHE